MILPSDDNSTPEKRPQPRNSDANPDLPEEEEAAEPTGPPVWMPEELWKNLPDIMGDDEPPFMDQEAWREMLRHELESCIFELENFPDPECDFDPPDPPDLYTFHTELISLRQALQNQQQLLLKATQAAPAPQHPALPQALVVQLGLLAGELRAQGQTEQAERILNLIETFS